MSYVEEQVEEFKKAFEAYNERNNERLWIFSPYEKEVNVDQITFPIDIPVQLLIEQLSEFNQPGYYLNYYEYNDWEGYPEGTGFCVMKEEIHDENDALEYYTEGNGFYGEFGRTSYFEALSKPEIMDSEHFERLQVLISELQQDQLVHKRKIAHKELIMEHELTSVMEKKRYLDNILRSLMF